MKLLAVLACVALASGTGAVAKPARMVPALVAAGATVKSWGATLRDWKVDAAGHVEHVSGERPGANRMDIVIETRRLTLSRPQMRALAAAVTRVESILRKPEQCTERVTDGPYGSFRWDRGKGQQSLPFDGNCMKGRDYDLASAIFAADEIVDKAAKKVEPVERHPLVANIEVGRRAS